MSYRERTGGIRKGELRVMWKVELREAVGVVGADDARCRLRSAEQCTLDRRGRAKVKLQPRTRWRAETS